MTDTPLSLHHIDSGSGPAIIILHGLLGTAANLGTIQRHLQSRYRVVAIDLRNHGASPHAPGMTYAVMAADVLYTLDQLGIEDFQLIGHSMGGKVAMRLALDHPARIRALTVLDIAPTRYRPAFRPYTEAMLALPLRPDLSRREADIFLTPAIPDQRVRGFLMQNLRFGPPPQWRIGLQEISDALPDIEDWRMNEGEHYDGPVQFIAGAQSDYIRQSHMPVMRALFPNYTQAVIESAGHWLHAENPAAVATQIDRFLQENNF